MARHCIHWILAPEAGHKSYHSALSGVPAFLSIYVIYCFLEPHSWIHYVLLLGSGFGLTSVPERQLYPRAHAGLPINVPRAPASRLDTESIQGFNMRNAITTSINFYIRTSCLNSLHPNRVKKSRAQSTYGTITKSTNKRHINSLP